MSAVPEYEPITEPGIYHGIAYYPLAGSLSVSSAKTLLKAPALYKWQRENHHHSDAFDFGSAAHALVLGVGLELIYVAPFDSWQTKAAQEERKLARESGLSPILPADWQRVCAMADQLASNATAMQLLSGGDPEVYALAADPPTGIMRRAWIDYLTPAVASDYKSAASVEPGAFATAAARYGYHMQAAWTLDLLADLGNPIEAFAFIAQEKEPPYLVEVYDLDDAAIQRGRDLNRQALERFRDCTESGIWPGYTGRQFTTLSLPKWALYESETA
jgi:hypothetical protein